MSFQNIFCNEYFKCEKVCNLIDRVKLLHTQGRQTMIHIGSAHEIFGQEGGG